MDLTCAGLLPQFPDEATRAAVHGQSGDLALTRGGFRARVASRRGASAPPATPLVLLSTSGTTGSAKFVRLTARNVAANASQIAQALHIGDGDVGLAHLPIHYSYGLSVITSHLQAGAAV